MTNHEALVKVMRLQSNGTRYWSQRPTDLVCCAVAMCALVGLLCSRGYAAEWKRYEVPSQFSIAAPDGSRFSRVKALEHSSAILEASGFRLQVFLGRGPVGNVPVRNGDSVRRESITIDSRSGWLDRWHRHPPRWKDQPYELEAQVVIAASQHLSAIATCRNVEACQVAKTAIESIRMLNP